MNEGLVRLKVLDTKRKQIRRTFGPWKKVMILIRRHLMKFALIVALHPTDALYHQQALNEALVTAALDFMRPFHDRNGHRSLKSKNKNK